MGAGARPVRSGRPRRTEGPVPMNRRVLLVGSLSLGTEAALGQRSGEVDALRALAAGGVAVLIRHNIAPGSGDPPGFRIDDCATQRNLSEAGRSQSAALGNALRDRGVRITEVRSSRWCRALDTARLAFPDRAVAPDPLLDSFFDDRTMGASQTERARALIQAWQGRDGVLALVTHQVNITALTDIYPQEGDLVVVAPGSTRPEVVGRLRF